MAGNSINILCASDEKFIPYCGTMLTSLFENNRDSSINVYLLSDDTLTAISKKRLVSLAQKYSQTLSIIKVDASDFARYPVHNSQWNNSIYYRLLVVDFLPVSVEKVIYLDSDIIVDGSLKDYWGTNVEGYALGAVPDAWCGRKDVYERLSLPDDGCYFNSGSMLINLKYWREYKVKEQFLEYIDSNFEKLWFNDQDTLNGVFFEKKLLLPVKYNFQVPYLKKDIFDSLYDGLRNEILATSEPRIIHYSSPIKPWMVLYYNMPYKEKWKYYKRISFWKKTSDILPEHNFVRWMIKRFILWPLGMMETDSYLPLPQEV